MADGERPNSSGDASALLRRGPSGCGLTAPVAVAPVELRRGGNCKVSGGVLGAKDFFSDGCVWVGAPRSRCHIQCDDLRPPAQRKPGANSTEGGSRTRGARYQGLPSLPHTFCNTSRFSSRHRLLALACDPLALATHHRLRVTTRHRLRDAYRSIPRPIPPSLAYMHT